MTPIEIAGLVSLTISMTSIPLIIMVLLPHALPRRLTGITSSQCLTAASFSILITTLLFAGQSVLDLVSKGKTGSTPCAVDALLETYFKTAILAHLAVLAVTNSTSIPLPSRPDQTSLSPSRQALLIILAYTYALFPLIPTLTTAASLDFKLEEGFGKWWGVYCIDRASWWRIVRPLTLLPPLLLTLIMCFVAVSSMYSTSDHPSIKIRPTKRRWILTFYLLTCAIGGISYLILEQVIGWKWDWWPRVFETLLCVLVWLPYACNKYVWRPYPHWIRLKRCPPSPEQTLPLSNVIGHPQRLNSTISDSARPLNSHLSTTSSFCAVPATPIHDLHKGAFYTLETIHEAEMPRRDFPGRNAPALRVQIDDLSPRTHTPDTPPFVYSIAGTMQTTQTTDSLDVTRIPPAVKDTTRPSPLHTILSRESPLSSMAHSSPSRTIPPPLNIIGPSPIATTMTDDMSVYSRYTEDADDSVSGVTSVFATRHSIGSSLPQFTPSFRTDGYGRDARESVGGEVVFAGARVNNGMGGSRLVVGGAMGQGRSPPGTPRTMDTMETMDTAETGGTAGTFGRRLLGRGGKI